ncbi:PREDICTED: ABSCISIC ACID-INSENSITIVE 5-like protein 8 [Camelina sativa]|uniref:ABSCISIC ACID-INSENSITIVE 5-like protein 8 n=1 Tax=Camelina sativa TaxID=90675 RepID=A0ABM0Y203_CAMSA|nr:PREDICTED: ABSCISIC ACID-INSENSITIVE 5-like protein 8 [Camelina sativa]
MDSYWRLKNLVYDVPVSRQGSIYSWTVDQFQTSLGKNCGSMNMDELVKNISSAEETQEGLKRQGSIRQHQHQTVQAEKRSLIPRVATNPSGAIACSSVNPFPILNKMQNIDGTSSLLSPSPNIFSGSTSTTRGRKIDNAIAPENKIDDKKLKRKIKNRESAARSRARKQAKTMELELELENLKKKYQELLREQVDMRKMQTEPGMIQLQGRPERKLRRTKSDIM